VNSNNPQPLISYDGHTGNVTSVGFQKDGKWMYTGSEDGTGGRVLPVCVRRGARV
jgi:G protein beta subunit-like protein